MLTNRIIGAFTLRKSVYAEVEKDTSFTSTAWILVVVVAFLSQLGSYASSSELLGWLIGAIVGTILAIIGFVVGALVINWAAGRGEGDIHGQIERHIAGCMGKVRSILAVLQERA